ncbi:hypothetical protein EGW08_012071 [Elysia chlorotica]|uniref:KxDL domain-containing protein n=1 Tax=Elysia chlorotica TaxID=188477 RepID=A0A433TF38_ELYCH|nr:hypothetical protein EGW08_012071 [Elysia chlorotica]
MASREHEPDRDKAMPSHDDATTFAASLINQVNREDIPQMVYIQRDMLGRFEKTNEMLINFNMLSSGRYEATLKEFQQHTQLLFDMKKDLNSIFRRHRVVKSRLEKSYPDAFAACSHTYTVSSDDEDVEDKDHGNEAGGETKTEVNNVLPAATEYSQSNEQRVPIYGSQGAKVQREFPVPKSTGPVVNVTPAGSNLESGTSEASKKKLYKLQPNPKS